MQYFQYQNLQLTYLHKGRLKVKEKDIQEILEKNKSENLSKEEAEKYVRMWKSNKKENIKKFYKKQGLRSVMIILLLVVIAVKILQLRNWIIVFLILYLVNLIVPLLVLLADIKGKRDFTNKYQKRLIYVYDYIPADKRNILSLKGNIADICYNTDGNIIKKKIRPDYIIGEISPPQFVNAIVCERKNIFIFSETFRQCIFRPSNTTCTVI